MITHQIRHIQEDQGTYQGTLNKTNQKHGFGIYRTDNFDTYFGEWKNNYLEGKGLIIFRDGKLLYSNFHRNQPYGMSLLDDRQVIRCSIIVEGQMCGLGFQYVYANRLWRMVEMEKNQIKNVYSENIFDIQVGLPYILRSHEQYMNVLNLYRQRRFFANQNIYSMKGQIQIYGKVRELQNIGLAVLYQNSNIRLIGNYENGKLNGCILKYQNKKVNQIGFYKDGKKHGYFETFEGQTCQKSFYLQDGFIKKLENMKNITLKSQQNHYHTNSKDFIQRISLCNFSDLFNGFNSIGQMKEHQKIKGFATNTSPSRRRTPPSNRASNGGIFLTSNQKNERVSPSRMSLIKSLWNKNDYDDESCVARIQKKLPHLLQLTPSTNNLDELDQASIEIQENPFRRNSIRNF